MGKLKTGDKIFYLDQNRIKQDEIKGTIIIEGEAEFKYDKFKSEKGKTKTIYQINAYNFVEQKNAFKTKQGLIRALSKSYPEKELLPF